MDTKLTSLLQIQYPILQGGMAWASESHLAAAVSNAGGAGTIGASGRSIGWLEQEIRRAHALTSKPFGVNIPVPTDIYSDQAIQVLVRQKPAFVTLSAGKPSREYVEALHQGGMLVFSVVPNLRAALSCQGIGVDALIIEGAESGGRIGNLSTLTLMEEVIPSVDIPVVAAGGFSDGRGLAAALVMGACGIQMGTRFMGSVECEIHPDAKRALVAASSTDIVVTGTNRKAVGAARGLNGGLAQKYFALEDQGGSNQSYINLFTGTNFKGLKEGDLENGFIMAGEAVSTVRHISTAAEIVNAIVKEAEQCISSMIAQYKQEG